MPHMVVQASPRRPFREVGAERNEVMFVRSGILAKYKSDESGRRQIVALRFPGDGILPAEGRANYGIQAIVRSEVLIGKAEDFNAIVDKHPQLQRFFRGLVQRNEAIGYEWLVNCGRRDSIARVAHLLCETAARTGIDCEHEKMVNPFTQQQIADMTGQTSVNVNRVFADLERQGLIERVGREIAFKRWSELRRLACFQPAYLERHAAISAASAVSTARSTSKRRLHH
ncbi:MAG TPA: Crp/Fnr family transcriptional regulator [Sphingomicrobium sp.]|nr:Crp/Fnr family transcriptional regulator [Sphingomicrobium sp.]